MSDEQNNAVAEAQSSSASDNPVRARILAAMKDETLAVGNFADLCGKGGIEIPKTADPLVLIIPVLPHHKRRVAPASDAPSINSEQATTTQSSSGEMTAMFDSAEHLWLGDNIQ
ncbi:MAG: hypothetical protein M3X11_21360 [Acidobacteriota bacterium]|nr:hypothetical protein [Acidobacteriota bacterium]